MINLDSIKLKVPSNLIKIIDINKFDYLKKTRPPLMILSEKYCFIPKDILGLKSIIYDVHSQSIIIEMSAKFLEEKYFNLINRNTINYLLKKLLRLNILSFNINDFLNYAQPLKLDVTSNIKMKQPIKNYIMFISYLPLKRNATITVFKDESVVITNSLKSKQKRLRQIIYDKETELNQHNRKECFCNHNDFHNILRFESNLNSFYQIKKQCNVLKDEDFNLSNILNKNINVNENIFNEFFPKETIIPDVTDLINCEDSLSTIIKKFGQYEICKKFDFDFIRIKYFLKNKVKGNISTYLNDYNLICSNKINPLYYKNSINLFDELKYNLKNAS
jgi:hypothetical protein